MTTEHVVDTSVDPLMPMDSQKVEWEFEEKGVGGRMMIERNGDDVFVDGRKIDPYLSKSQQGGESIEGNELLKELKDKSKLSAHILDDLLAYPTLVPSSWEERLYFWGTIYRRRADGRLAVRCLLKREGVWTSCYGWLDLDYDRHCLSAVLVEEKGE